jgi:hypothetical protein
MQNQLHTSSQRGRQGLPSQEDAQQTTPQGLRVEQNANMFGEQLCAVVLVSGCHCTVPPCVVTTPDTLPAWRVRYVPSESLPENVPYSSQAIRTPVFCSIRRRRKRTSAPSQSGSARRNIGPYPGCACEPRCSSSTRLL